jgi:hypothetical protein
MMEGGMLAGSGLKGPAEPTAACCYNNILLSKVDSLAEVHLCCHIYCYKLQLPTAAYDSDLACVAAQQPVLLA